MADLLTDAVEAAAHRAYLIENDGTDAWEKETPECRERIRANAAEVLRAALPYVGVQVATKICDYAEEHLYDGDRDRPLPGYLQMLDLADLIRGGLVVGQETT